MVLDACVLIPPTLADTILRIAENGVGGVRWSADILDEVQRNMIKRGVRPGQAEHRLEQMAQAFPLAMIEGYEPLVPVVTNDPKDRHVLAAAIRSDCHTIVTFNLKDFPESSLEPWGIEVIHPDRFLLNQLDIAPHRVMSALRHQSAAYQRPPLSVVGILARLQRSGVPDFAEECRRLLDT